MSFTRTVTAASIASTRDDIRIMKQYLIVWFTVLIWDTLATFPSEYKYIWKAKWTPLKIAFLINRYWTIGAQASTCFLLLAPLSPNVCQKIFWGFATDGISIMFFCDCIVAIRVYAVYEKSRKMLYVLIAMLVTDLGLMIGAATQLRPVIYSSELREALDFKGCAAAIPLSKYSSLISILYWSPPLLFNAIALGLILFRNVELSKQAGRVPILQRMLRDGLFFFLVIMASNLVNVILVAQSNPAIHNLNVPASLTLTSLMCSRLVLSLHQHNTDVRRSIAGYGNSFVTSNPGPGNPSIARPSVVSLRTRARQPSRPGLDEYLATLGPTEQENEDDDGESRDSPTTALEEGSRESLSDKFRYTVQFDPTIAADPASNPPIPLPEVERLDEVIARRPPTRQGRRESIVSFVSAHSIV